jgi:hypothetical protein
MILRFAIIFGIGLLFPVLVRYSVQTYQPLPSIKQDIVVSVTLAPTTPEGWKVYEEEQRTEQEEQQKRLIEIDEATQPFYRALILVATPVGIAAILIGSFLKFVAIGEGLMLGGFISIADGFAGYWAHLDDWVRFSSLLAAFCLACFAGYREFMIKPNSPA